MLEQRSNQCYAFYVMREVQNLLFTYSQRNDWVDIKYYGSSVFTTSNSKVNGKIRTEQRCPIAAQQKFSFELQVLKVIEEMNPRILLDSLMFTYSNAYFIAVRSTHIFSLSPSLKSILGPLHHMAGPLCMLDKSVKYTSDTTQGSNCTSDQCDS